MKSLARLCLVISGTLLPVANWQAVTANRTVELEAFYVTQPPDPSNVDLNFDGMAERIVSALKLQKGERVLIRFDPDYFAELVNPLRSRIRKSGATEVGAVEYALMEHRATTEQQEKSREFERLLEPTEVYLWLPVRTGVREIPRAEAFALGRWLDKGGARRQIHFHWALGSVLADGLTGLHTPELDRIYQDALDIDYQALSAKQNRAITLLRSGTVRIRTGSGTDLSFKVGQRPFNQQNGDASPERMKNARIPIDREIELPAGVVRVAPLEETVNGRIAIPSARFGDKTARDIKLEVKNGVISRLQAAENLSAVETALGASGAGRRFREFGLGFNPKLQLPPGSPTLAYFGYGAGVVRLSLGDNQELGGSVSGGFVRWFFFPNATVEVDGRALVREGELLNIR